MLFRAAVVIIGLCLATPGLAQTPTGHISGRVIEARTNAPLAAVLVQVQSTRQRAISDPDGQFDIPDVPVGKQTLVVSVIGYGLVRRDVEVSADQATELTIPVAEGASTYVEEVTVAASAFREAEPAAPSQSVLGSRELLALRGVLADDPFRAVQTLPGVTTGDDFKGEFAIRGLGPQHIGISVDGVDSPFLFHTVRAIQDTGSLALINSDILDQAVLLAGPHPQKLGSHLGARLDFMTREGTRNGFAVRALVSGSAATGLFEGPIGSDNRGSWLVAARRSYIDWLLERVDPEINGSFGFTDVQGGVSYDLTPRQQLKITFIGGRSVLHDQDEFPSLNALERGSSQTAIANARWRLTLSPSAIVHQQLYLVRNTYENNVTDGRAREEGWDRDVTWRGSLDWSPTTAHAIELGAQVQSLRARRIDRRFPTAATAVTTIDANLGATSAAAYLAYRWTPSARFVVAPGARLERFDLVHKTEASPWLLAEWQLMSGLRLRSGAGIQYQSPSFDQALLGGARDALRPERATSIDLSLEQRVRDTWRVSVTAYQRHDRDRLRVKSAEFRLINLAIVRPATAYIDNVLSGRSRGVELTFERRSVNGWTGWVSYALGKSTVTDESRTLNSTGNVVLAPETYPADFDQRHTVNIYSAYRWSGKTSLSARFRFGSNFPISGYFEPRGDQWTLSNVRNRARLPEYARLDLRADRAFTYRKRRLTLFMEVINVFNRDNFRAQSGSLNPSTRDVSGITERVFPLLPSAGVLIEF
jgi:outer membrane receptor for ferrienterochelin and colicin